MKNYRKNNMTSNIENKQKCFENISTERYIDYLRRINRLEGAPNNIRFFTNILNSIFVQQEDIKKNRIDVTVGTYGDMVPQELIYAAGAIPVGLSCGGNILLDIGNNIIPGNACSLVKSIMEVVSSNVMPVYHNCELMVVQTNCDCKRNLAMKLNEYKETIALNVPTSNGNDIEYFTEELYKLIGKLQVVTDNKITYRKLAITINMMSEVQYEIARFLKLKKQNPLIIKGTHAMTVMNSFSYCHAEKWYKELKALNDELEINLVNKIVVGNEKQPRIMLIGSSIEFPNINIPLLIEEMGGLIVADETCMKKSEVLEPISVVDNSFDGLIRALAKKYVRPSMNTTFSNRERIIKIKKMIQEYKIEGIVYNIVSDCKKYDYEYDILEREMRTIGLPIIRLESDYGNESNQINNKIDSLFKMINAMRNKVNNDISTKLNVNRAIENKTEFIQEMDLDREMKLEQKFELECVMSATTKDEMEQVEELEHNSDEVNEESIQVSEQGQKEQEIKSKEINEDKAREEVDDKKQNKSKMQKFVKRFMGENNQESDKREEVDDCKKVEDKQQSDANIDDSEQFRYSGVSKTIQFTEDSKASTPNNKVRNMNSNVNMQRNMMNMNYNANMQRNMMSMNPNVNMQRNMVNMNPNVNMQGNMMNMNPNVNMQRNMMSMNPNVNMQRNMVNMNPNGNMQGNLANMHQNGIAQRNVRNMGPNRNMQGNIRNMNYIRNAQNNMRNINYNPNIQNSMENINYNADIQNSRMEEIYQQEKLHTGTNNSSPYEEQIYNDYTNQQANSRNVMEKANYHNIRGNVL